MDVDEFVKIANVLAWPVLTLFGILLFHQSLGRLLDAFASSLRIRYIKVKVFGVEVELTPEEVKNAVAELMQEISESTNDLGDEEISLFEAIVASGGRKTVGEIDPQFERDDKGENFVLKRLGRLRDHHLIRPKESAGRWFKDRHPIPTRFGSLVYGIRHRNRHGE